MPNLVIIAGPNGSGKTSTAPTILRDALEVLDYVNADVIAQGLSGFEPEKASIQAGRVMLKRIKELAKEKSNFAFETTLASRSFANFIADLKMSNYHFHLIFLWLQDVNLAISRVEERVKMGGHFVPEETIRRRYRGGLKNFFTMYKPIADSWQLFDNSNSNQLTLIASGSKQDNKLKISNLEIWRDLQEKYHE
jgi:predicted ABC-type ATPase